MHLHEALAESKSGCAQAKLSDGRIINCHSGAILHSSSVHLHVATGAPIPADELGYTVYVLPDEHSPAKHHEVVEEMWEVEESLRVNFGISDLDWEPHEIEEV